MKKKLITLSLMLAMMLCLAACGKEEQPVEQTSTNEVPQQTQISDNEVDTTAGAADALNETTLVVNGESTHNVYSDGNSTSENSIADPNATESDAETNTATTESDTTATTEEQSSEETEKDNDKISLKDGVNINLPTNSVITDERNDSSGNTRYTITINNVEYMVCTTSTPADRNSRLQEKLKRTLDATDGVFDVYTSGEFNDITEMNEKFTTVEVYESTSMDSQIHIMRQDYDDNESTDDCYECGPVYFAVIENVKTTDDTGEECMMTIRATTDDEAAFITIVKKMIP